MTYASLSFVETWSGHFGGLGPVGYGDLTDDGRKELVVNQGERVRIFVPGDDGFLPGWEMELPNVPVQSLALAPGFLAVGTGHAGTVRLYGLMGNELVEMARSSYLWSPVDQVLFGNFTGGMELQLLALTEKGTLHLLEYQGKNLVTLWESPRDYPPITSLLVWDVPQTGLQNIVVGSEGLVETFAWQEQTMVSLGRNYPWGVVQALLEAEGQLYLWTNQDILYVYDWYEPGFSLVRQLTNWPVGLTPVALVPTDNQVTLFGASIEPHPSFGLWRITTSQVGEIWRSGPLGRVVALLPLSPEETLVATDRDVIQLWKRMPGDYLRVIFGGEERRLEHPVVDKGGSLWISLRDVQNLVPLSTSWNQAERTITLWRGNRLIVLPIDSQEIIVDGSSEVLAEPAFIQNGLTYVPIDFLRKGLGFFADWNHRKRILWIHP
jgi:hypothetical protein